MDKLEFSDHKVYKITYTIREEDWVKVIYAYGSNLSVNSEGYFKAEKYYIMENSYELPYGIEHYLCSSHEYYKVFKNTELSARYKEMTECGDEMSVLPDRDEAYRITIKRYLKQCREKIRQHINWYREASWYSWVARSGALQYIELYSKKRNTLKKLLLKHKEDTNG